MFLDRDLLMYCTYYIYVLVQADANSNAWRKLVGPALRMKIGSEVRLHIIFSNPSNIQVIPKRRTSI